MQTGHPLAYLSQGLKGKSLNLSTYGKELLALVMAARKWRHYLLAHSFKVRTDQQTLKYFLEQRIGTPAQQKWVSKLLGFDFTMEYKKGRENQPRNQHLTTILDHGAYPKLYRGSATSAAHSTVPARRLGPSEVAVPSRATVLQRKNPLGDSECLPATGPATISQQPISWTYEDPENLLKVKEGVLLAWNAARSQAFHQRM